MVKTKKRLKKKNGIHICHFRFAGKKNTWTVTKKQKKTKCFNLSKTTKTEVCSQWSCVFFRRDFGTGITDLSWRGKEQVHTTFWINNRLHLWLLSHTFVSLQLMKNNRMFFDQKHKTRTNELHLQRLALDSGLQAVFCVHVETVCSKFSALLIKHTYKVWPSDVLVKYTQIF